MDATLAIQQNHASLVRVAKRNNNTNEACAAMTNCLLLESDAQNQTHGKLTYFGYRCKQLVVCLPAASQHTALQLSVISHPSIHCNNM